MKKLTLTKKAKPKLTLTKKKSTTPTRKNMKRYG